MKTKGKMFKNLIIVSVLSVALTACGDKKKDNTKEAEEVATPSTEAVTYKVDTNASVINWEGSKPTGTHTGTIMLKEGTFNIKDNTIEGGTFVIDMNSIVVTDQEGESKENLEAHLKGTAEGKENDFFNVTDYPTSTFAVTGMEKQDDKHILKGNLTMKDITKNVSFPVVVITKGDVVTIKSETFEIDRTKWNVNYGSKSVFDNLGDKFIDDEMVLTVSVVAKKA